MSREGANSMSDTSRLFERRQYTEEFKKEAMKLVLEQGYTARQAGKQLGIPHKTLANWVRPFRKEKRSLEIARGVENDGPAALRARIVELEKQLRRTEMEREILKKATAYFAKENL
jgi:transposase